MSVSRKMRAALVLVCGVIVGWAGAVEVGITFGFEPEPVVGARIEFVDWYALQADVYGQRVGGQNNFGFFLDHLFYFAQTEGLRHYAGVSTNLNDDGDFGTGAFYGIQHPVTTIAEVYGQVGVSMDFDSETYSTLSTGIGLIFFYR